MTYHRQEGAHADPSAHILVIDDEDDWCDIIERALNNQGYSIRFARTYTEAIDLLGQSFDLAIMNVVLRREQKPIWRMEWTDLLIEAEEHDTDVIAITAMTRGDIRNELCEYDVAAVLSKQKLHVRQLRASVKQVLLERTERRSITGIGQLTWLHISDLHFHPPNYGTDIVLENLLDDIKQQMVKHDLNLDFVAVTGDVAHTGNMSQYKHAIDFFDRLLQVTGLQKRQLFVVPGNHDIDWALIKDEVATEHTETLTNKEVVDSTLGKPSALRRILGKFRHYKRFVNTYLVDSEKTPLHPCDHNHLFFTETIKKGESRIGLLGLNSAWMSAYKWRPGEHRKGADDRHNLILGRRQLREALKEIEGPRLDVVIALMHHPTEWLKDEIDREEIEALLEQNCHFILRGHLHDNKVIQQKTPGGDAMTITAGASFKTRGNDLDYNGYNFVRLDFESDEGTIYLRCYSKKHKEFWTADVFSYPDLEEGHLTFPLPKPRARHSASVL
jgi:CheY-like chemotaxis protein